jgi:hypothetical protein
MRDFFQISSTRRRQLVDVLQGDEIDAALVCNVVTGLAHRLEHATHHTPVLDFKVVFPSVVDARRSARLVISNVPSVSYSTIRGIVSLHPLRIYRVRFVFRNETDHQQLWTGCVEVDFWRAAATSASTNERFVYTPCPRRKARKRIIEIDYEGLNTSADDRANIERVMDLVHHMAREMPQIGVSCELLMKRAPATPAAAMALAAANDTAPKKRARTQARLASAGVVIPAATAVDDDTAITSSAEGGDRPVVDDQHVGFCLFFAGVPNFESNFLDYLNTTLGNLLLEAVVLAPVRWTDPAATSSAGHTHQTIETHQELAISLRRARCTEAESGPYCVDGSQRLMRVMARNAVAFKGVATAAAAACVANTATTNNNHVDDDGDAE